MDLEAINKRVNDWMDSRTPEQVVEYFEKLGVNFDDLKDPEPTRTDSEVKSFIIGAVKDLANNFIYYDRKEDEELNTDDITNAIKSGVITVDEITDIFKQESIENL